MVVAGEIRTRLVEYGTGLGCGKAWLLNVEQRLRAGSNLGP